MANLGDKRGYALGANDLVTHHSGVQQRHENAGNLAGVGEDLQQLLPCNRHGLALTKKPAQGGWVNVCRGLQLDDL